MGNISDKQTEWQVIRPECGFNKGMEEGHSGALDGSAKPIAKN